MKVLQVREAAGDRPPIALHSNVTVVRGLDPLRRAWLIDVLGRLSGSGDLDATGEVEAHGIRMPVARRWLTLLDLSSAVGNVVRAEDLPGHDPRIAEAVRARDLALVQRRELTEQITRQREALGAAVAARTAAQAAVDELERGEGAARTAVAQADAARARLEAELASASEERVRNLVALREAVLARDMAEEARASAAQRVEQAQQRRRDAMAAATAAAAAVEQARPLVADDPTDELVARRAELDVAMEAAAVTDPTADGSPVTTRLAALEQRRVELVRLREAVGAPDADPVADALARVLDGDQEAAPVVAALALADTWRDLHQQLVALDAGVSPEEMEAEQRVAAARQALIEAEIEFNQPVLTPEQIAKVEAAHAAVLEAQDKSEGRFGGSRQRKKLEDARAEERRVLERLGFSTYADYMMSSSSRGAAPSNRATLDAARTQLRIAEESLAAIPGASDRNRRRQELLHRRDAVAPRVAALIGHEPTGPEAEEELRNVREPSLGSDAGVDELAEVLSGVGVVVGEPPYDRDDVVLLARFYLSEREQADEQLRDIVEALTALDDQIAILRAARERDQHELPPLTLLPELAEPTSEVAGAATDEAEAAQAVREGRWAAVEAARAAVAAAEERLARHREAVSSLSALEAELARASIEEEQAAAAVAAADAELELANGPATDQAAQSAAEAEAAVARSAQREEQARAALAAHSPEAAVAELLREARTRLAGCDQAVTEAAAAEQVTAASLAEVDAAYATAAAAEEQALAEAEQIDRAKLVDDVEWSLMSRLASVRAVGLAGALPLVLDDPFPALEDDEVTRVLDRVTRLADAVQLVVVSDREAVVAWAAQAGSDRVLVTSA